MEWLPPVLWPAARTGEMSTYPCWIAPVNRVSFKAFSPLQDSPFQPPSSFLTIWRPTFINREDPSSWHRKLGEIKKSRWSPCSSLVLPVVSTCLTTSNISFWFGWKKFLSFTPCIMPQSSPPLFFFCYFWIHSTFLPSHVYMLDAKFIFLSILNIMSHILWWLLLIAILKADT